MYEELSQVFRSGTTRKVEHRIKLLRHLKDQILKYETKIFDALKHDLGKSEWESRTSETGFVIQEITHTLDHIYDWTRTIDLPVPIASQPADSRIIPSPKGVILVIAPWNYPFQLALAPMVSALAAGNTVGVKPSELTPAISKVIKHLIDETFPHGEVKCMEGGPEVSQALLLQPFDHFFFTGSTRVGKIVARAAAEQLASFTLELGGKSPCIVDSTAVISQAARRIAWGKTLNAGQTCIAPDYLLVQDEIHDQLIQAILQNFHSFFGDDPSQSQDFGRIVNLQQFDRLANILKTSKGKIHGGRMERANRFIEPTLVTEIGLDDSTMQEEIFGPILPILKWKQESDIEQILAHHKDPLAFYVFTSRKPFAERLMERNAFGGGCINHVIHHIACPDLPFGGIRSSGVGQYHGKFGFDTFTHYKGVVDASPRFDLAIKYPPYNKIHPKFLKWLYR